MAATEADWRAEVDHVLREGEEDLNLHDMSLGAEGAAEVAENLRGSTNAVKVLTLEDNKIGDGGAQSVAELLRSNPPALEEVDLSYNDIGRNGISALADALRHNTTVRTLDLDCNKGVDPDPKWGGSAAEAAAGIASLVAAINVNATLREVDVSFNDDSNPHQKTIDAALADTEGRRAGRERFLTGPLTKAARKSD
jgi:Ran GTPase-activating protein (RanGAP) involved in mRNA processing and transport